jgi:hypothetical protein
MTLTSFPVRCQPFFCLGIIGIDFVVAFSNLLHACICHTISHAISHAIGHAISHRILGRSTYTEQNSGYRRCYFIERPY